MPLFSCVSPPLAHATTCQSPEQRCLPKTVARSGAYDDEDLVELSAEELASLRHGSTIDVPTGRGWSSGTFVCHRNPASCALSCCCPCVQFGVNQRQAFGSSCTKWSIVWLLPLLLLYIIIDHRFPSLPTAERAAEQVVAHIDSSIESAGGSGGTTLDRESALFYACPVAALLIGLVGAWRRRVLRRKYGIGGTLLGDCMCHACCTCCSLARVSVAVPLSPAYSSLAYPNLSKQHSHFISTLHAKQPALSSPSLAAQESREIRRQTLDEIVSAASTDLQTSV